MLAVSSDSSFDVPCSLEERVGGDSSWLCNPSYKPVASPSLVTGGAAHQGDVASRETVHHQKSTGTKRKKEDSRDDGKAKLKVFVKSAGDLEASSSYRVDSKADSDNLHYAGLYSGDVATYRRRFEVVGLGCNQWVELNDGRSKMKEKAKKEKQLRYFKMGRQSTGGGEEVIQTLATTSQKLDGQDVDFLNLEVKQSADSVETATVESTSSRLTSEYNRSLLEDPHNVQLWLEFIALQDHLGGWSQAQEEKVGKIKRAVLERKVAILERALESNPTSVELLIGHMELVREFWETEKIIKKWKDIVFHQPQRVQLWQSYIHFCQTSFSSFTVSSQLGLYRKCITTLVSIMSGSLQSHRPEPRALDNLLSIFFLYCQFLQQAGYSEKSVASYQALIEFNLCCPDDLSHSPLTTRLQFFETFWDSGCPRFGEQGALGWHNWTKASKGGSTHSFTHNGQLGLVNVKQLLEVAESADLSCEVEEGVDSEVAMITGQSPYEAWLTLELHRTLEHCLPWRPDEAKGESEEDCTDPDRLVLFDDISPILVDINDSGAQTKLVLGFIQLLGAPVPITTNHMTSTTLDSFTQLSLDNLDSLLSLSNQSVKLLHCLGFSQLTAGSLADFGVGVTSHMLSGSPHGLARHTADVHNVIVLSINHALSLLSDPLMQTQLAQVLLMYLLHQLKACLVMKEKPSKQTKLKIKAVQKLIKNILRLDQHRNNLALWKCCALSEHLLGNHQDANKLFQSLLSQHPTPPAQLTCCYCECLIGAQSLLTQHCPPPQAEQLTLALHAIVCLSEEKYSPLEGSAVSAARILRARTKFEQNFSSGGEIDVSIILCHCYLEYLTRGLGAAGKVFEQWTEVKTSKLQLLARHSNERENLLQTLELLYTKHVQLVDRHAHLHQNTPPKVLKLVLEKALSLFPEHSFFLAKFINSEQQSYISGRVRRFFDSNTSSSSSALPWLYSVAAELQRYCYLQQHLQDPHHLVEETGLGTTNRLKAVLSRATESTSGQYCPLLWRMYMIVLVRLLVIVLCYTVVRF